MKKALFAVLAVSFAACLSMPAAAETFTTSDGVLSIELPNENWKELEDPTRWVALSDGGNVLTIDHFSNGEPLPAITVADDYYVNVYQAVYSTQNEVFIITGSVVNADKISEVANMILSTKVLKRDTKLAVRRESTPAVSEFSIVPADKTMYVSADGLNVRTGWSTDDQILGSFGNGAAVHVTGVVQRNGADYGWYQVSYGNVTGYVSSGFLSDKAPEQKKESEPTYSGSVKTVYAEDGSVITLYEAMDGFWHDKEGTAYTRISDTEFQVYEGTKRVFTYDITAVTNDYNPADYAQANNNASYGSATVYGEDGSVTTLYEGADGFWYDKGGTAYTRISESEFQVYEGTKRVFTYDITAVTNDYNPEDYAEESYDASSGVVTAYAQDGSAVTLYESTDGYWYDREGSAYIRHSDSDFQVVDGNRHLTVY